MHSPQSNSFSSRILLPQVLATFFGLLFFQTAIFYILFNFKDYFWQEN